MRCRRAEGNAFWKGNDGKHFDCCWRWSELGRWEADLQRQDYPFSIDGLSLVNWGISKANATGDVYNLTDVSKFGGTYVAAEAGLTLAGGMGGMVLRNADGVILHLRSVSQGAQLQLGTSGLIIKMK